MASLIKLAWRNVRRNRRRTMITAMATIVSVAMLILFNGLLTGFLGPTINNNVELETGHIKIYPRGYHEKAHTMPIDMHVNNYNELILVTEEVADVEYVTPRIKASGTLIANQASSIVIVNGIDPESDVKIRDLEKRITQGQYLAGNDTDSTILGASLADVLDVELNDVVSLSSVAADGSVVNATFKVKATFRTGFPSYDRSMMFIPLSQAQNLFKLDDNKATEIVIAVDQPEQAKEVANNIVAKIEEEGHDYEVLHWEQLAPELMQFVEMENGMLGIIALVVIVVASVGILNTMIMAVYERIKEIGVLAAFGYKRRDILLSFLLEGLMIGLVGASVGCLLGVGITQYLSIIGLEIPGAAVVEFMDPNVYPRLSMYDVAYPFLLAVVITLLAALYPAYKASRMEPVEALRHV